MSNDNSNDFFWDPNELDYKDQMRTPLSDMEVSVLAKHIAIYRCIDHNLDYDTAFLEILNEVKAWNETIKAQCQPH